MLIRYGLIAIVTLTWSLAGWGIYQAFHDQSFSLKVVEMNGFSEESPVDAARIRELADVPTGKSSILSVDLAEIEKRILSHQWIKSVHLEKRPPQTLVVSVSFREPVAIYQNTEGRLSYLDSDGRIFGPIQTVHQLPVVSGVPGDAQLLQASVQTLKSWNDIKEFKGVKVSSVTWDQDRGYRLAVIYSIKSGGMGRTMLNLGKNVDFSTPDGKKQIQRLSSVFKYLSDKQISARQIFAEVGKKIIVKIAQRS